MMEKRILLNKTGLCTAVLFGLLSFTVAESLGNNDLPPENSAS